MQEQDERLETRLKSHFTSTHADRDAADRVLRRLSTQALPSQHRPYKLQWPSVLLNFDFTPSWPRVAAFAACIALGFVVGLVGIDARIDDAVAERSMASADLPSLVSDAEPITGLRP